MYPAVGHQRIVPAAGNNVARIENTVLI